MHYVIVRDTSIVEEHAAVWDDLLEKAITACTREQRRHSVIVPELLALSVDLQDLQRASISGILDRGWRNDVRVDPELLSWVPSNELLHRRLDFFATIFEAVGVDDPSSSSCRVLDYIGLQFLIDWYPSVYSISHLRRLEPTCVFYQCPLLPQSSRVWKVITRRYAYLVQQHIKNLRDDLTSVTHEDLVLLGLYTLTYSVFRQCYRSTFLGEAHHLNTSRITDALTALLRYTVEGS